MVGSGPNGLVAAVTLARAGCQVTVIEAADQLGGGMRTEALTLPGFLHDVCSAVHPLAVASPAIQALNLEQYGLQWLHHEVVATNPLAGGSGATLYRDLNRTANELGVDQDAYLRLLERMLAAWPVLRERVLGPLLAPPSKGSLEDLQAVGQAGQTIPRWVLPAEFAAQYWFAAAPARALLASCAAHAFLPLHHLGTAGFGALLLVLAHCYGWPIARGGSQAIADALAAALSDAGGKIELGRRVHAIEELPNDAVVLLDLTAHNAAGLLSGTQTTQQHQATRRLAAVKPGSACWKIDYALDAPLPWTHLPSRKAGTVHLGGTLEEVAATQRDVAAGHLSRHPFTLVAQPTLADPTRAPAGKHVAWVYAHIPHGPESEGFSESESPTEAIERQLERFAPGFRSHVLARSVMDPSQLEAHNANYTSGDITGGKLSLMGLLRRPRLGANPYRLGRGVYMCSASTPPGPGTHGMAGYHAAQAALRAELA